MSELCPSERDLPSAPAPVPSVGTPLAPRFVVLSFGFAARSPRGRKRSICSVRRNRLIKTTARSLSRGWLRVCEASLRQENRWFGEGAAGCSAFSSLCGTPGDCEWAFLPWGIVRGSSHIRVGSEQKSHSSGAGSGSRALSEPWTIIRCTKLLLCSPTGFSVFLHLSTAAGSSIP